MKISINNIIAVICISFVGLYVSSLLLDDIVRPIYPQGFPEIDENKLRCESTWEFEFSPEGNFGSEQLVRSAISELGPDFDYPNREIKVDSGNIDIQGEWKFLESENAQKLLDILESKGFVINRGGYSMSCVN